VPFRTAAPLPGGYPVSNMILSFWRVALVAFAVRLLFLAAYSYVFPEHWNRPVIGGWEIGRIALNLYEGRGFSSPFSAGSEPTAWVSPVVPALWAGVMKLMRDASGRAEFVITTLQAIASSLAAGLYVVIFRRVSPREPRAIAVAFAAAVVLWPESLLRMTTLWYYTWQELAVAVLVWLGIEWSERRSTGRAIALGISGGVAALVNVSPLVLFAVALFLPALAARDRAIFGRACLGALAALVLVTPWLVRHRLVFGTFVPLRGNIGVELLQGNNPDGSVRQQLQSLHPYNTPAEFDRYQRLGEIEYSREAARRAFAWIRENPRDAAAKVTQRIYVVWFTDLTDRWSWDGRKWWHGRYSLLLQSITILSALVPFALAVVGVARVGFRAIPHRWLLAAALLVPLPHYFTQVEDSYVAFLRLWLLMIAGVCFSTARRPLQKELEVGVPAGHPK
jgi:hypothetical protein